MNAMNVRSMTYADWDQVAILYAEGIETGIATFDVAVPTRLRWDMAHMSKCRLVLEQFGVPIGFACLAPVSDRVCYKGVAEVSIYIGKDWRNRKMGTALLGELIRESEEAGIWTLQSTIIKENIASIKLHEACGFRMVGTRERIAQDIKGVWHDTILMERRSDKI